MEPSDLQNTRSPRRELQLQGPRPAPLKVRKDSYKIRKPPVPPQQQQIQNQQPQQIRPPVIIYTVSPKVIHTNPSEFMTLVQRLTGSGSSSSSTTNHDPISPAARLASIEKTKLNKEIKKQEQHQQQQQLTGFGFVEGIENIERSNNQFPGILSPGPTSLPVISPHFFSPPSDPTMINMFHDLSPVMHGNRNFIEGSFMPSPSTSFISPRFFSSTSPSTTPSVDLFNNFFDY